MHDKTPDPTEGKQVIQTQILRIKDGRQPDPTEGKQLIQTQTLRFKDGRFVASFSGRVDQKEEGTLSAVQSLMHVLGELGQQWSEPELNPVEDSDIDVYATGPQGRVGFQVVRVPIDERRFATAARKGRVENEVSPEAAASHMLEAIAKKGQRGTPAVHHGVVLVLDATTSMLHEDVVSADAFDSRCSEAARSFGFREVWLVGTIRVHRLLPRELPRVGGVTLVKRRTS
jgi:hypothetical protein